MELLSVRGDWKYTLIQYLPLVLLLPVTLAYGISWWHPVAAYLVYIFLFNVSFAWWHHKVVCHGAPGNWKVGQVMRVINALWGGVTDSVFVWQHVQHHKYADTPRDPHHVLNGAWKRTATYPHACGPGNVRAAVQVMRTHPHERFLNNYYMVIWVSFALVWYMIDPVTAFWLHTVPAGLAKWGTAFLAGVTHKDNKPRDCVWLYPILFGECFHKQHHDNPARLNSGPKWCDIVYWWGSTVGKPINDRKART